MELYYQQHVDIKLMGRKTDFNFRDMFDKSYFALLVLQHIILHLLLQGHLTLYLFAYTIGENRTDYKL